MKTNAKEEFIDHTEGKEILCAQIQHGYSYDDEEDSDKNINLPMNYTEEQYKKFLSKLDFLYDCGYGGQEVYGLIWYKDGTWSTRGEYDGSEWWSHHSVPEIPQELKQ